VKAWPLLTFAILTGRLTVDLDLLLVKDLGGFGHAAEHLNPDDYTAARQIAARLGWSPRWTASTSAYRCCWPSPVPRCAH
jgi:hypothetical protein